MPLVNPVVVSDAALTITDVTTNNATTSAHGFLKKLDNTATNFMNGAGNWATPAAGGTTYRKMTAKAVNTTVTETDLLNGEITVAANAMSTNKVLRLHAFGDILNNAAANLAPPNFKLKLGATTLIDTGASAGTPLGAGAVRGAWVLDAAIHELDATNAQAVEFAFFFRPSVISGSIQVAVFTTGIGSYRCDTLGNGDFTAIGVNSGLAVDTTASCALVLSVINPSASATFETKLYAAIAVIE